jgi:hypothetical protein
MHGHARDQGKAVRQEDQDNAASMREWQGMTMTHGCMQASQCKPHYASLWSARQTGTLHYAQPPLSHHKTPHGHLTLGSCLRCNVASGVPQRPCGRHGTNSNKTRSKRGIAQRGMGPMRINYCSGVLGMRAEPNEDLVRIHKWD